MTRQIATLTDAPKNPVSRVADRRVMKRIDYKQVRLSEPYRTWYVLSEKAEVEKANGETCYFAINQATGVKSYIAKSDVQRITRV